MGLVLRRSAEPRQEPTFPPAEIGSRCHDFHSAPCQGGGITRVEEIRLFTAGPYYLGGLKLSPREDG